MFPFTHFLTNSFLQLFIRSILASEGYRSWFTIQLIFNLKFNLHPLCIAQSFSIEKTYKSPEPKVIPFSLYMLYQLISMLKNVLTELVKKKYFLYLFTFFVISLEINLRLLHNNPTVKEIIIAFFIGSIASLITTEILSIIEKARWEDVNDVFYYKFNGVLFISLHEILEKIKVTPTSGLFEFSKEIGRGKLKNEIDNNIKVFSREQLEELRTEYVQLKDNLNEVIRTYIHKLNPEQHSNISRIIEYSEEIILDCDQTREDRTIKISLDTVYMLLTPKIQKFFLQSYFYMKEDEEKFRKQGWLKF